MAKKTTRRTRPRPTPLAPEKRGDFAKTGDYRGQPIQRVAPSTTEALLPAESGKERPAALQPTPKKQVDFAAEYHYVLGDLRKMAVLAAGMFVVLILLSFVIR
jgi:hypothetical protein